MNKVFKLLLSFVALLLVFITVACGKTETPSNTPTDSVPTEEPTVTPTPTPTTTPTEVVDYAGKLKLDRNSGSFQLEVTVYLYVDGDTTHFNVPESVVSGGIIKARYLAINTPESTGKIEDYGKTASKYTRSKLESAASIIIESDTATLNADSTGSRYLLWVWYKPTEDSEYRNLNVELLQEGLAIASNSGGNRYGETCLAAIAQAKAQKLYIYSGKPDPDTYHGSAVELTLKELRANIDSYNGVKVAFEANVYKSANNSVYLEEYDAETDAYYGIGVYLGFSAAGQVLEICSVGNRVRMVGTVQYYEAGGTYQISGLTYRAIKPKDPDNVQKIETDSVYEAAYKETSADRFVNGTIEMEVETETGTEIKTFKYAEMCLGTSISMKNLEVKSIYTTTNEESSSKGAMTLTCEVDGITITVRTNVLTENGVLVTADKYQGKNISVKGVVEYYNGSYQIKVFSAKDIIINK